MDIGLGWLGVGVGLAGCLATFFMAAASVGPREAPRRTRLAASLTLLLTIILWADADVVIGVNWWGAQRFGTYNTTGNNTSFRMSSLDNRLRSGILI